MKEFDRILSDKLSDKMPEMMLDKRMLFMGLVLLLLMALFARQLQPAPEPEALFVSEQAEQWELQPVEEPIAEIVVHVAGAVVKPGVYTLQEGQRVEDAITLAGLAADGDADALNRAAVLSDGQKIVVPVIGAQGDVVAQQGETFVDLNQADLQQLMTLPGIGQVKAQAILDYRQQQGPFKKIEEIQQVDGIGTAIFAQIKNKIKI